MPEQPKNDLMLPDEIIMTKIYLIREQKVMLDSDLAEL
ncbi:ORF6N domain-containing protein [Maribellus sp. YY47]|nr:ORF6N domain-containing protein [Maribellus sp. YY47]MCK3685864.1 ORF6N domain-containing protein [Maribellus sp. YY47]